MDLSSYAESMIGVDWVQGSDDPANGGVDCWGLIHDCHLKVKGIKLPKPAWRDECKTDEAASDAISSGLYVQVESPIDMDIFTCHKDGAMTHCGLISFGMALHAAGSIHREGKVCFWPIATVKKVYGEVKYYRLNRDLLNATD